MILVYIEGMLGDCKIKGFDKYFSAESFSFGVEREVAESGKAGTGDINIGVGELQECSISKSMDTASTMLARRAISGASCGTAEIKFVESTEVKGERFNVVYLHFKLDTCFIKSWNISGDADDRPTEDVTLWYNRIAFNYWATTDGMSFVGTSEVEWDQVAAKRWKPADASATIGAQGSKGEMIKADG